MPPGTNVVTFVLSDGLQTEKPKAAEPFKFAELCKQYRQAISVGTMEASSIKNWKFISSILTIP